ncbi:MAG TPA: M56 family metallopeptidase [Pirellulales bacterium]|nr:M56 family metallopeptidase [Pirellulales bacterium]
MTWLVAIGLANALWSVLLAAAAVVCGRWLRRPALAHLLWIVVLAKLLTPPVISLPLGDWLGRPNGWLADAAAAFASPEAPAAAPPSSSGPNDVQRAVASPTPPANLAAGELEPAPGGAMANEVASPPETAAHRTNVTRAASLISPAQLMRIGAAIWLFGSAFMAIWMARRAWQFHVYLKFACKPDDRLQTRLDRLSSRAGLSSAPRVVIVENVVSPMLWGLRLPRRRPSRAGGGARLIFPGPLASRLDAEACDALLLHELAHYARGDGWVRLLELLAQVLYWWHPLVWLARREIEAVEEECCDAWALERQTGSRRLYAEALLATVDFLYEPALAPLPPAACGLGEAPLLRRRLTQIMCCEAAKSVSRPAKALVIAAAAVVLPLRPTFFGPVTQQAQARSALPIARELLPPQPRSNPSPSAARAASAPLSITTAETAAPTRPRTVAARPPALLWAEATSSNGKYRLEARTGRRTTLVNVESDWRLDLTAHQIACASFSPDSRNFATGHDDSTVRIWDSETGGLLASLKGSESPISSIDFAPEGARLAAGAADGGVLVWDWAEANEIANLPRQSAPVGCLRWSPQGDRLAIALSRWASEEGAALWIWSPADRQSPVVHPLIAPAGALDWLDRDTLIVAAWDGQTQQVSAATGKPLGWLKLDKNSVSAAAWSPDCPLISKWQAERLVAEIEPFFN